MLEIILTGKAKESRLANLKAKRECSATRNTDLGFSFAA